MASFFINKKLSFPGLMLGLFLTSGCQSMESTGTGAMNQDKEWDHQSYRHGVNLSHYLSQSKHHGFARPGYIEEKDLVWIASRGYDHIRLPVDGSELLGKDGTLRERRLLKIDETIGWAHSNGLNVLLDVHELPGSTFSGDIDSRLFTDDGLQETAMSIWRVLSERYQAMGLELRFEILNEPVAERDEDVTAFYQKVLAVIRESSPGRVVYLCSNRWGRIETLGALKPLLGDPNVAVDVHYYDPHLFTHQKASWVGADAPGSPPVPFPGIVPDLRGHLPEKHYAHRRRGEELTVEEIEKDFERLAQWAKSNKIEVYVGEFGVYEKARDSDRENWYRAVLDQCRKHDLGWAVWDYKGGFAVRDSESGEPTLVQQVIDPYLR
jgi:endoglucanase